MMGSENSVVPGVVSPVVQTPAETALEFPAIRATTVFESLATQAAESQAARTPVETASECPAARVATESGSLATQAAESQVTRTQELE
ncbi:MAG: hypothetical protein GY854_02240 [Deltaproteobacteria bacterium]|nr:hypothetical protein [Deltaproteobacteria bacterium]